MNTQETLQRSIEKQEILMLLDAIKLMAQSVWDAEGVSISTCANDVLDKKQKELVNQALELSEALI